MLDDANIVDIIINLEDNTSILLVNDDMAIYEELNFIITKCMLKAEKKYRKIYMEGVHFSPKLVIHLDLIICWRLLIHNKRSSCTSMCTLI